MRPSGKERGRLLQEPPPHDSDTPIVERIGVAREAQARPFAVFIVGERVRLWSRYRTEGEALVEMAKLRRIGLLALLDVDGELER